MYAAVAGQGGITRLVLLPHEGHGYRARESILHALSEQHDWLVRWVINKDAKPDPPTRTIPNSICQDAVQDPGDHCIILTDATGFGATERVSKHDTIHQLKMHAHRRSGWAPEDYKLFYKGKELKGDSRTLREFGVHEGVVTFAVDVDATDGF